MRPAQSAIIIAGVLLLLAGGAYALLATTASTSSVMISADIGCRHGRLAHQGQPQGPPAHAIEHNMTGPGSFELDQPAGEWVARITGDGVSLARLHSATPEGHVRWEEDIIRAWCHGQAGHETYITRGEGHVTIRYWLGEPGGLRVG